MKYIILDLEWNQSGIPEESVKDLTFEIVEVGAVKLNEDRVMVDEFSCTFLISTDDITYSF